MQQFWIVLLFLGIYFIYLSTKNIYSFPVLYYWLLAPAAFYCPSNVLPLLSLSAVAKGIGALSINKITSFKPTIETNKFRSLSPSSLFLSKQILNYTIILNVILVIICGMLYFKLTGIALFAEDVGIARLIMKSKIPGWFIFIRFIRMFFPILIMMYSLFLTTNAPKKKAIVSILILINAVFLLFLGFKGNLLMFVVYPLLLFGGLALKKPPHKALFIFGISAIASAMFIMWLMTHNQYGFIQVFVFLWNRLTAESFDGISFIVSHLVPREGLFYGGTYLMDIKSILYKLGLLREQVYNFSEYVSKMLMGEVYTNEQAGNAIEGELYANFGFSGIIFGGFLVGIILQYVYIATVRAKKDIVITPFVIYIHLILMIALGGPVISVLMDYSIALAFFLMLFGGTYIFLSLPTGKIKMKFNPINIIAKPLIRVK